MLHDILFIIIGFALIIIGGNFVTDGAVAVAKKFRISPLTIGLTVVALGSAMPDLVVCVISAAEHKSQLAIGDVVGSNIFDILMVTGTVALISPVVLNREAWRFDIPILLLSAFTLFIMGDDKLVDGAPADIINRSDGIILLMFLVFYMSHTFLTTASGARGKLTQAPSSAVASAGHVTSDPSAPAASDAKPLNMWVAVLKLLAGFGALIVGGNWLVDGASGVARAWGMSEGMIGLTIVGIGSGAPDMASSVIAAIRKQPALAIGNVVGACIINVFLVLGVSATVSPLRAGSISTVDFGVLVAAALLLLMFGSLPRSHRLNRIEGVVLVLCYLGYATYLVMNMLH